MCRSAAFKRWYTERLVVFCTIRIQLASTLLVDKTRSINCHSSSHSALVDFCSISKLFVVGHPIIGVCPHFRIYDSNDVLAGLLVCFVTPHGDSNDVLAGLAQAVFRLWKTICFVLVACLWTLWLFPSSATRQQVGYSRAMRHLVSCQHVGSSRELCDSWLVASFETYCVGYDYDQIAG